MTGMTITEKILAAHSGRGSVAPGELVQARIDLVMCHDVTTTPAIEMLRKGGYRVFDPSKVVVMPDHFVPNKDIQSAELVRRVRAWVRSEGIENYYELGRHGVCHALLPEQGYVEPGATIICGDSHTCTHGALGAFAAGVGSTDIAAALATGELWFRVPRTSKFELCGRMPEGVYSKDVMLSILGRIGVDGASYMAMEFSGEAIAAMSAEARMTVCNMAIEAGAKTGIISPDEKTVEYVEARGGSCGAAVRSDRDATYTSVTKIDVSAMEPMVALPHLPSNVRPARLVKGVAIDQAYLGSCTNGRIEDLRAAASIMEGRKVAEGVRMIVVPATMGVWKQASKEGLLDIFADAEAAVSVPTCGACLGGHMGILADGERCISSTNRNFVGRMGSPKSEVYLASPATVAASAIKGEITDPREAM